MVKAIAVHKDVDACHPANAANVFDEEAWSSVVAPSGNYHAAAADSNIPAPKHGDLIGHVCTAWCRRKYGIP